MNGLFFIVVTLFFIVLQTVVLPRFSWFVHCFDLILVLVVFLSLNFSHYAVLAAISVIGVTMDCLSGAPFFLYTFSYIWTFLMIRFARQLVFQHNTLFLMLIGLMSVLIEQGFVLFAIFVQQGQAGVWETNAVFVVQQAIWGMVLIPPGEFLISVCYRNWQGMGRTLANTRE